MAPCSSDHMEPTAAERENQRMCLCVVYLQSKRGEPVADWAIAGAESIYGVKRTNDWIAQVLCSLCERTPDAVIYDGRERGARRVADWWDDHKAKDEKRRAREKEKASDPHENTVMYAGVLADRARACVDAFEDVSHPEAWMECADELRKVSAEVSKKLGQLREGFVMMKLMNRAESIGRLQERIDTLLMAMNERPL